MSLLNDMLNDLNSRDLDRPGLGNGSEAVNTRTYVWKPSFILFLGLTLTSAYFYVQDDSKNGKDSFPGKSDPAVSGLTFANDILEVGKVSLSAIKNGLQPAVDFSGQSAKLFAGALFSAADKQTAEKRQREETRLVVRDENSPAIATNTQAQPEPVPVVLSEKIPEEQRLHISRSPESMDREVADRAMRLIAKRQGREAETLLLQHIDTQVQALISVQVLADYYYDSAGMDKLMELSANTVFADPSLRAYVLARHYALKGENKNALALLRTQKAHPLLQEKYLILQAGLSQKTGAYEDAEQLYEALLTKRTNNPVLWLGYALACDANKKPRQALRAFHEVKRLHPANKQILEYAESRILVLTDKKNDAVVSAWE